MAVSASGIHRWFRINPRRLALFAAVYYLALARSEHLWGIISFPSPFWLPDAVLLSTLLLEDRHSWLGYLSAAWLIRLPLGAPPGTPSWFLIFAGLNDTGKALGAAWWLTSVLPRPIRLTTIREFRVFLIVAAGIVPFVAAIAAIPARHALGDPAWAAGYQWFLGDALAQIVVTPTVLFFISGPVEPRTRARSIELAGLLLSTMAVLYLAYVVPHAGQSALFLYSPVPFLIWAALRFPPRVVAALLCTVSLASVVSATNGSGMFAGRTLNDAILSVQLFIGVLGGSLLSLAIANTEREARTSELNQVLAEQITLEHTLRESEERFRAIADTAPALIWMSEVDASCTFLNERWLAFTGRTREQELGLGWVSGVHPEDLPHCRAVWMQARTSQERFQMEYRLRRHDGEYRWLAVHGAPRFDSAGHLVGYIGSGIDVTDLKLAQERLQELSGRLIDAQEQERRRIARELHDDVGQQMALLQIAIEEAANARDQQPSTRRQLSALRNDASTMVARLHTLSHELHPSILSVVGLVPALRGLCREYTQQHGVHVEFAHANVPDHLSREVTLCLYRVAQEALRNIVKHGAVNMAAVTLYGERNLLELRVTDRGVGFMPDAATAHSGLGLVSMRERLRLVGGELEIQSAPGHGTEIRASVAVQASEALGA